MRLTPVLLPVVLSACSDVRELALDGVTPDPASLESGAYRLRRRFLLVARAVPGR